MGLDDAEYDRQAQARAFTYRRGGKERFEHPPQGSGVHSPTVITDRQAHGGSGMACEQFTQGGLGFGHGRIEHQTV